MNDGPVGFFDSGLGGLSIWKAFHSVNSKESTVYLADSSNAPYGIKSKEKIQALSLKNVEKLLQFGCKVIVVACNTATSASIDYLRQQYHIPIVGIEPAVKPAALSTSSGRIGVLATEGTLSSSLFQETSERFASHISIIEQNGTGLVRLIEQGKLHSEEMKSLVQFYIDPMLEEGIDRLVLGCTHYPFLRPLLEDILPEDVKIIDSGRAVAKRIVYILDKFDLNCSAQAEANHQFYTNLSEQIMTDFMFNQGVCIHPAFLEF